jgi:hypothetical protein
VVDLLEVVDVQVDLVDLQFLVKEMQVELLMEVLLVEVVVVLEVLEALELEQVQQMEVLEEVV